MKKGRTQRKIEFKGILYVRLKSRAFPGNIILFNTLLKSSGSKTTCVTL